MNALYTKTYSLPPFNEKEILRYCGAKEDNKEVNNLLKECLKEAEGKFQGRVVFTEYDITKSANILDLGFAKTSSMSLIKNLEGCKKIILFGATVGIEIDRLIFRYSVISPAKAVIFQAVGAERIEKLCDVFNQEVNEKYQTVPRFSPGYGDLPLAFQQEIFKVLDCQRKIGLTINDSLLMSPTKSVTGVIGIKD